MQEKDLNQLDNTWDSIKIIIPYGFGCEASLCIDKLMEDFDIPFIIDNNPRKVGTSYKNIPIISWLQAKGIIGKNKIIITTRYRQYMKIKETLHEADKEEYTDYCWIKEFIPEWYWKNKKECCLYTIDLTVSAKCDFKCINCNMFMPYYKKKNDITYEELTASVDAFFKVVDYVFYIGLIGGEPLLCNCLPQIITYISDNYGKQVGTFAIHTNASIEPSEQLIDVIKRNKVIIAVSDYGEESPCRDQMLKTIEKYENAGISCDVRSTLEWKDMGFPQNPKNYSDSEVIEHVKDCSADWRGLNDGKFYFCNIAWSAEKSGLIELQKDDYIDLKEIAERGEDGKYELLRYSYSAYPKRYLSFCKICGGCGIDNTKKVVPGRQIKL